MLEGACSVQGAMASGSVRHIGSVRAQCLGEQGSEVVVTCNRTEAAAGRCRRRNIEAIAVDGEKSDDAACGRIVKVAASRWSRTDVSVSTATATCPGEVADPEASEKQEFDVVFGDGVVRTDLMRRAPGSYLREMGDGPVVVVSPHSGFSGIEPSIADATSRGAPVTLNLSHARAVAPNIREKTVGPGILNSAWMSRNLTDRKPFAFKL